MQPTYYEFILAKYEDIFGCKKENKTVKGYQKITETNGKSYRGGGANSFIINYIHHKGLDAKGEP